MGRIHGDIIIERRENIQKKNDYTEYRKELSEDFHNLCGYCGQDKRCLYDEHQIDHFVPVTTDKDREKDYYNLVYCCSKCNQSKSKDWPTGDKNKSNDGIKGYCDPATKEFDKHLERNEEGDIIPKTELGKYMYKRLHFDIRPISYFWKLMKLMEINNKLKSSTNTEMQKLGIMEEIERIREYLKYTSST